MKQLKNFLPKTSGASYMKLLRIIGELIYTLIKDKNGLSKSKTLICHFNQNTPVRPSVRQSIHPSVFAGYEMTSEGTKWPKRVQNDLGKNWPPYSHFVPSWPRYEMTKIGTK